MKTESILNYWNLMLITTANKEVECSLKKLILLLSFSFFSISLFQVSRNSFTQVFIYSQKYSIVKKRREKRKKSAISIMNPCERLTALCGSILGLFAFILACTALSSRNWEIETHVDYFHASSKYNQLHLSRIMSIFSLIFTLIGIFTSSYMIIK